MRVRPDYEDREMEIKVQFSPSLFLSSTVIDWALRKGENRNWE